MCVSRLSCRESADNHYKAVCRALLAETLELSTFLDQIAKGTKVINLINDFFNFDFDFGRNHNV